MKKHLHYVYPFPRQFLGEYQAAVQEVPFDQLYDNLLLLAPGLLRFSFWMLNHCVGDRDDIRKWSLLPIAKHQIGKSVR